MSKTLLTAHSGCEGTAPNSQDYIDLVKTLDVDVIEIDVRLKDGKLLLSHNEIADDDDPVAFEEAVLSLKECGKRINCDLKEEIYDEVRKKVAELGLTDQVIYSGSVTLQNIKDYPQEADRILFNLENLFQEKEMEALREAGSNLTDEKIEEIFEVYKKNGISGMNVFYGLVNEKFMEAAKKAGVRVAVWTVDDQETMERMKSLGVYSVTTHEIHKWKELEEK